MTTTRRLTLAAGIVLVAAAPLTAQAPMAHRPRWGPQVSYHFDASRVGVGGRVEYSLARLVGSNAIDGAFEANWFPGTGQLFDFNYNVLYRFHTPQLAPYAGGGLNFSVASGGGTTASKLHLNAVGGLRFQTRGPLTPILQLRYTFGGGDALILTGGFLF